MRRPYLIASLAVHAAVLVLLYYFGTYQTTVGAEERQLASSRQLDRHAAMRGRVADMEQIKALMRESMGEPDAAPDAVRFDATTAEAPADLLARAEALAKDIDALGERAKVDAYARATGLDREEAARQLAARKAPADGAREAQQDPLQAPPQVPPQVPPPGAPGAQPQDQPQVASAPPPEPDAAAEASAAASTAATPGGTASASTTSPGTVPTGPGPDPAATAARVAALEQRARDVLSQRRRQLERAEQGIQVGTAAGTGTGTAGAPGLAGRIAAFVDRAATQVGQGTGGSYRGNDGDLFDRGTGAMANVARAGLRKVGGHVLGAGGEFANRVYVDSWYLIGPFAGKHGRDMFATDRHPPEQAVVLDAAYRGKGGRFLTWRYVDSAAYPLVPPDMQEDSVYYGYTELMMDSERTLAMWVGADDDVQVWVNDRLEWKGGNVNKLWFFDQVYNTRNDYKVTYNLNEGKVMVHFRQGRNKLFFKLSNGPNKGFLSLVLALP